MIRIANRFCGPPGTGNGGYVSGRIAALLPGPVEVTLRAPTPLEVDLPLTLSAEGTALRTADGALLAEAACVPSIAPFQPLPISFEEARDASKGFIGFRDHPYPGCFVCGTEHASGLALYPGAVASSQAHPSNSADPASTTPVVAAPFRPSVELCDEQGLLQPEYVWSALDCPSWFGHAAFQERSEAILLGRLAVQILRRPKADEPCVVQGFSLGQQGRRILCGSALYGHGREIIAYARSTWIQLKS